MPALGAQAMDAGAAEEVRAALGKLAASEAFRSSPQLVAFLRYVVEATLRGEAERIKGYTIAVEGLGRRADFDPQSDPIVRVEASRLRKALNRYYADDGATDTVIIDLPPGSYVPAFRCRSAAVAAEAAPEPVLPVEAPAAVPAVVPAEPVRPPQVNWSPMAAAVALVLLGGFAYGTLERLFYVRAGAEQTASASMKSGAETVRLPDNFPVVFVAAFKPAGNGAQVQNAADAFRARLRDALARFDEIAVVSGAAPERERARAATAEPAAPNYYDLTARLEYDADGLTRASMLLTDVGDGRIAFSQTFERPQGADRAATESTMVRDIVAALAQPYGVIHSRERANQIASPGGNAQYRCLIEAYDYFRNYEPKLHAQARACLERSVEADPSFAAGFAMLAQVHLQEYRRDVNVRPGDSPPLDRALIAARRAHELQPGSARANQALMDTYFLRGDRELTLSAGAKAVALNPYNPNILATYGGRLVALGELEKGAQYLKEASATAVLRPPWHDFYLFLVAYLTGDNETAIRYANHIISDKFLLGLIARTVAAVHCGEHDVARQYADRIADIHPGWREDPRRQLKKILPLEPMVDRLARDLAQAGLGVTN